MTNLSVARRYSRALIDVAAETGAVEKIAEQLDGLARVLRSSPELADVLANPAYSRAQRSAVVDAILEKVGSLDPALVNLVRLLVQRNRMPFLTEIARLYRDRADARAGRIRGKVTSAVPLAKEDLTRLEKALEKLTQRNVVLETKVDPSLIGGVSAQVGSLLYDGSLRTQLDDLRRQLRG